MSKVKAIKNGVERDFTEQAWNLMGKDKNGYVLVPNEARKGKQAPAGKGGEGKKGEGDAGPGPIATADKTSKDFTIDGVITKVKEIESIEALNDFAKGEDREAVINVIKKRNAELVEAADTGNGGQGGDNDYKGPFSNDEGTNVKEAKAHIDTLETVEAINNYVPKDEARETVTKYRDKKIADLSE